MKKSLLFLSELFLRAVQIPIAAGLDWALGQGWWRCCPWIIRGYAFSGRYCNRVSPEVMGTLQRIGSEHSINHLQVTSTGVLQCFCADQVFLLPCGEVACFSLEASFRHWTQLRDSEWKSLVDYRFSCVHQDRLYSMELLKPTSQALEGLQLLKEHASAPFQELSAFDWAGQIDHLAAFCDVHAFNSLLQSREQVRFGLVHGDLHPGNVMENSRSQRVLIDLDRMCLSAPLCIDQIHLRMCALEQVHGCSWLAVLAQGIFERETYSREQLLAYLLFRATAETQRHTPGARYRRRLQVAVRSVSEPI